MSTVKNRVGWVVGFVLYLATMVFAMVSPLHVLGPVRIVFCGLATLVGLTFVVAYSVLTKGHWKDSEHGTHVMVFSFAVTVILGYAFVSLLGVVPRWFLPYSSALIYSTMGFLMLWRLAILLRDQRPQPKDN